MAQGLTHLTLANMRTDRLHKRHLLYIYRPKFEGPNLEGEFSLQCLHSSSLFADKFYERLLFTFLFKLQSLTFSARQEHLITFCFS